MYPYLREVGVNIKSGKVKLIYNKIQHKKMNQEQDQSLWKINAEAINPNKYFGAMVANGMIGIVSAAQPMQVDQVILNGVYDRYQRGKVSNILKGFNPFNIDLAVNGQHLNVENIQNYRQSLDMKQAKFRSTFETSEVAVQHEIFALRNLPYTAMVTLKIEAKEDSTFTFFNNITSPDHLREVHNYYSEIDRPHVKIPLLSSVAKSPTGRIDLAVSNSFIFEEGHGNEPQLIHEDWDFNRHLIKFSKTLQKRTDLSFQFGKFHLYFRSFYGSTK